LSVGFALSASSPPDAINYQGVLRNSSNEPLDGTYGMLFRFFSADSGGEEILVDAHGTVTVSGGLFNVQLGSGSVTDGSGPGEYTTLSRAFADYPDLHVEVEVGGETLSPRIRVTSAGYALNTRFVRGMEIVSDGPLDLYVDGIIGDDDNDGLSPDTAKRTITAAIERVPAILTGPSIVYIADGTYNEEVFIGNRTSKAPYWVILQGNQGSPENVVLDGEGFRENGIDVYGVAEIRGMTVTRFTDTGIEFSHGFSVVEDCRLVDNFRGLQVGQSAGEVLDSIVSGNSYEGIGADGTDELIINGSTPSLCQINNNGVGLAAARASRVFISGCEVNGNTAHGIVASSGSHLDFQDDGFGSLEITGNLGHGVLAEDSSSVEFNVRADLTIQANGGDAMHARFHSTIRSYGNGTTGSCVEADAHSMCVP
jgi:hypothetical protein